MLTYPAYPTLPLPLVGESGLGAPLSPEDLRLRLADGSVVPPESLTETDLRLYRRLAAEHRKQAAEKMQRHKERRGNRPPTESFVRHRVSVATLAHRITPGEVEQGLQRLAGAVVRRVEPDGRPTWSRPLLTWRPTDPGDDGAAVEFELSDVVAVGKARPYVPRVKGDLAKALTSPQSFTDEWPLYPAPLWLLTDPQLANQPGLTAQDVALVHLLLAHAQRSDPGDGRRRPLQQDQYEIPLAAVMNLLGLRQSAPDASLRPAGRRDVDRSLERLAQTSIQARAPKAPGKGRKGRKAAAEPAEPPPPEPAITAEVVGRGRAKTVRYSVALGLRQHFHRLGRYAHVELGALARMRLSYAAHLYLFAMATTYRANYRVSEHWSTRVFKPVNVAAALGYPVEDGALKGGFGAFERRALNADVIGDLLTSARRFAGFEIGRQQDLHARGKPVTAVELKVRIARPAIHDLQRPLASSEDLVDLRIVDAKDFAVPSGIVLAVRRLLGGLPQPEDWRVRVGDPPKEEWISDSLDMWDWDAPVEPEAYRPWKKGDPRPRRVLSLDTMIMARQIAQAWTVAIHEALGQGGPYGPSFRTHELRGERLLRAIKERGASATFLDFALSDAPNELRRWIIADRESFGHAFEAVREAALLRREEERAARKPGKAYEGFLAARQKREALLANYKGERDEEWLEHEAAVYEMPEDLPAGAALTADLVVPRSTAQAPAPAAPLTREAMLRLLGPACAAVDPGFAAQVGDLAAQAAREEWYGEQYGQALRIVFDNSYELEQVDRATGGAFLGQFRHLVAQFQSHPQGREFLKSISETFAAAASVPEQVLEYAAPEARGS